jgi:hypothetical protein
MSNLLVRGHGGSPVGGHLQCPPITGQFGWAARDVGGAEVLLEVMQRARPDEHGADGRVRRDERERERQPGEGNTQVVRDDPQAVEDSSTLTSIAA